MARRRLRLGGLGLVGGLLASVLGGGAAAQDTLCDPAVPLREDVNYGYQDRGDRCEGIYANSPVSGSTIGVASFTKGTVSYEFTTIPLEITWPSGLDQPVRLRAKPLRPDLFYQMDTFQPATASSFVWPTDFLLQYQIKPQDDLLDQGGRPERRVLERTALGFGFYPADSGVPIELPDLAGPGIYKVKLIAKLLNGIERPEDFWFYHPTD
jgi:hypothetical protein